MNFFFYVFAHCVRYRVPTASWNSRTSWKSPGILKVSWNVLENEKSPGKVLEFHVAISRAYVATATIVATATLVSI